jgi:hypothetical protein
MKSDTTNWDERVLIAGVPFMVILSAVILLGPDRVRGWMFVTLVVSCLPVLFFAAMEEREKRKRQHPPA